MRAIIANPSQESVFQRDIINQMMANDRGASLVFTGF